MSIPIGEERLPNNRLRIVDGECESSRSAQTLETIGLRPQEAKRVSGAIGKVVAHHLVRGVDSHGRAAGGAGEIRCQILHAAGLRPQKGMLGIRGGVG